MNIKKDLYLNFIDIWKVRLPSQLIPIPDTGQSNSLLSPRASLTTPRARPVKIGKRGNSIFILPGGYGHLLECLQIASEMLDGNIKRHFFSPLKMNITDIMASPGQEFLKVEIGYTHGFRVDIGMEIDQICFL